MVKTACIFPGQGSQSLGMLAELAAEFPLVQDTFAEASSVFGQDLWEIAQTGPQDVLDSTLITQPLMLAADIAVWRVWQQQSGPQPVILAGHSLGEYAALVAAGALGFADAVRLVSVRARAMQDAVPVGEGAMVAVIGLDDAAVAELCVKASGDTKIMPANFNAPGQVVVAGHADAAMQLLEIAKDSGARMVKKLAMSVPSHCELMQPAVAELKQALDAVHIALPKIPVVSNVSAQIYTSETDIYNGLLEQIVSPVRWVETSQLIAGQGVQWLLECGPGKVLSGLAKRTIKQVPCTALGMPEQLALVLTELAGED